MPSWLVSHLVACQGLDSAVQAMGFDNVRLRSCSKSDPPLELLKDRRNDADLLWKSNAPHVSSSLKKNLS
jgi:hypothetical protein